MSGDAERKTWSVEGGKLCEQVGTLYESGFVMFGREMDDESRNRGLFKINFLIIFKKKQIATIFHQKTDKN